MKFTAFFLSVLLFLAFAADPVNASLESFTNRMQSIVGQSEKGDERIGIQIVSLNHGDSLYAHHENEPLNPASCTKIITTAAALKLLGPDFRFHTKFYTDRRPVGGIAGTLWVKGLGDPSIVIEHLWRIARDIANTGIKKIEGDIVIDDFYFEDYKYPGYMPGSGRAYNSLTGAVSLNYNTVTVVVSPGSYVGSHPNIAPDTAGNYFRIVNGAKTGPRGSKSTISVSRTTVSDEDVITINGSIPIELQPQYMYGNITDPPFYFGLALKSLLEQNGVSVGGQVIRGRASGGYLLVDSVSKPLSLILRDMNKFSNNFIAEQIVKVLGAEVGGIAGTTASGLKVIQNYLTHIGIPEGSYKLLNGSGLTKDNRVSASALTAVLARMYSDYRIAPEALSTFSIAGVDGTTKDRLTTERIKGLARAKTGSLNGVSTLVGTIPSETGEMLGYAILMNGSNIGWLDSHRVQESMLNAMAGFTR